MTAEQLKQKEKMDNSLTKNKFCFCKNYGKPGQCLICKSLAEGKDYRKINSFAASKYAIAVTGTNGKTTVTNILGLVLSRMYPEKVSVASTTGVYENGKKFSDLEHRASEHYVYLLNQPKGEIVVSEQPEAGIYKFGLPRDHNFGIIINMAEDHLERYWINSGMDDLYSIKSLVAKMSTDGWITSVDYLWTRKLVEDFDFLPVYLFGLNPEEVDKFAKKYPVTTIEEGKVVIKDKNKTVVIGTINDFLLTLNGILEYNIENLLAVITLFYHSSKFKPCFKELIRLLKNVTPSFEVNPARFNVLNYGENIIVFDYAHNFDGYKNSLHSLSLLKDALKKNKLVGLVAIASDRTEETIDRLAKIFLDTFDQVMVREVQDNQNILKLGKALSTKDGSIWSKGYEEFIRQYSTKENIVYITIAGHGHVADLRKAIKNLKIKEIARETFK